jgi:predicted ribosome quality control (RQC) complex YloA/Tae2 family protein
VEGGTTWLSIHFSDGKGGLLFSWDPSAYGCSSITEKQIDDLLYSDKGRHPLIAATKAHLQGSVLVLAEQIQEDRILALTFQRTVGSGFRAQRKLFFEATERYSNLILADEKEIILECAKHVHPEINRYRTLMPGHAYICPPPWKGISLGDLLSGEKHATRENFLNLRGFGKPLLTHVWRCWAPFTNMIVLEQLRCLAQNIEKCFPFFLGEYLTIFPTSLPESIPLLGKSGLEATWDITGARLLARYLNQSRAALAGELTKQKIRIEKELEGVAEQRRRFLVAEEFREKGELLLAHGKTISPGASVVHLTSWENPRRTVEIQLNPERSVSDNAQDYFKIYKKWKSYGKILEARAATLSQALEEVVEQESVLFALDDVRELNLLQESLFSEKSRTLQDPKRQKKRLPAPPPHLVFSLPGGVIFVGLNAKGNRYVTFQIASAEDLWFHAQGVPGAHVVAKVDNLRGEKREEFLLCAATLAAHYGKAAQNSSVLVDYTEKKHVRHIPGKGPSHVRYEAFRTLRVTPGSWRQRLEALQRALEEGNS